MPVFCFSASTETVQWERLEPGLTMANIEMSLERPRSDAVAGEERVEEAPQAEINATAVLLCIDPEFFAFSLHMASERGAKKLADVARDEEYAAAINASMYMQDGMTSTGYLRGESHTNNAKIGSRLGAFFVAEPLDANQPKAQLLDRQHDDWEKLLAGYKLVMQNFRMSSADGSVVWKKTERLHSLAALARDKAGNIFFILCPTPVPAADFVKKLQEKFPGMGTLMYLEGGIEAALYVNAGDVHTVFAGRHSSGLWSGNANLVLPNILGIRRRSQ